MGLRDFSAVGRYERRFERMGYEGIRIHGIGVRSVGLDMWWPDYPGTEPREFGNSIIYDNDGSFKNATIRFPGLLLERYERETVRSWGEGLAAENRLGDDVVYINTWAPFHALHLKVEAEDGGGYDADDIADLAREAKEAFEERFI